MSRKGFQLLLLSSTLAASWLAMMILHESGHILHALLSGGRIARVILNPLAFSRTDIAPNPHPAFVAWGGVIWGSIIPIIAWFPTRKTRLFYLLRFFAGFCLVANGVYLAAGFLIPAGDTQDLLRLGTPRAVLLAAGLPLSAAGFACWNNLGPRFGLRGQPVDRGALIATSTSLAVLLAAMLIWSALT